MPVPAIVSEAEAVTSELLDACHQAAHTLREGHSGRPRTNSAGVLIEPRNFRHDLVSAREKIDAALALFDRSEWPSLAYNKRL